MAYTDNFRLDYRKADHSYFNFPGPRTHRDRVQRTSRRRWEPENYGFRENHTPDLCHCRHNKKNTKDDSKLWIFTTESQLLITALLANMDDQLFESADELIHFLQCYPQVWVNAFQCILRFNFQHDHGRGKYFFQGRAIVDFSRWWPKAFLQG